MAKLPNDGSSKVPDHIDQIREIIFGAQKRDYDQRLAKVVADLDRYKEDVRTKAEDMEGSLKADIAAGRHSLEQEIRQLTQKFQEEVSGLQKRIEQTGAALSADFTARIQRLTETNTALRQELAETKTKLRSETRDLREQLSSELEAEVSALRNSNVSREAMAELLQELAMKLKGIEVLEELTKAARKTPQE